MTAHDQSFITPTRLALALVLVAACSKGSFGGEVTSPDTAPPERTGTAASAEKAAPPAPKHERVAFTWESGDDSVSGRIQTTLPDGQIFTGKYHEITRTATVDEVGGFYNTWYADSWSGPSWYWGNTWPYYSSVAEFITHYTGKVVATLNGDRGDQMRCTFSLDDPDRGLKGGGTGECQVSNGERITTRIEPQ